MLASPFLCFVGVWGIAYGLFLSLQFAGVVSADSGPSLLTPGAIALSVLGWAVGEATARMWPRGSAGQTAFSYDSQVVHSGRAIWTICIVFVLSAIGYLSFLETWSVIDIIRDSSLTESFQELNVYIADDRHLFGGLLGRLYVLPVIGLAMATYLLARGAIRRDLGIGLVCCFVFMLISPRRALLLQGLLLAALIHYDASKVRRPPTALIVVVVLALVVFLASQVALAKADGTIEGLATSVALYVAANIPTMDALLHSSHFEDTHVLLNVPFRVVNALFGTRLAVELDVPFVDVGQLSNTVPFQYYIAKDAGLLGVLLVSMLLGFFAQMACRASASRQSFAAVWTKAAFLVFIAFSFREFTLITYDWIFFLVVAVLISSAIHTRNKEDRQLAA